MTDKKIFYIAHVRLPTEKAHGVQIMKMCEAFARAGKEVELIVTTRHSPIKEEPFFYYGVEKNFTIRRLPCFDLVHLGRVGFWISSISFALSVLFFVLLRKNLFYTRDEFLAYVLNAFHKRVMWEAHRGQKNFFVRALIKRGVPLVVISSSLKEFYTHRGATGGILLAHDGVDMKDFEKAEGQEEARKRLAFPLDKKIALYIGSLDGWKGTETLLAASRLFPQGVCAALVGGKEERVKELRAEYPGVFFAGFRPYRELAQNLATGDVLVLPNTAKDPLSAHFTSPLKLFAYMASGVPIVASDVPSVREILDEESAYFFVPDDAKSLAEAVRRALSEGAHLKASRAREKVKHYTWQKRAETILTFAYAYT